MFNKDKSINRILIVLTMIWALTSAILSLQCTRPPSIEEARTDPNWYVDTTSDWEQRLHCPDANGHAVFLSTGDIPMHHVYNNVVYVLGRRGDYWIGYTYLDRTMTANLPVKAWSLDSAYCMEIVK